MITLSEPLDIATEHGALTTYVGLFGDGPKACLCGVKKHRLHARTPILRVQYGCAHGTIFRSLDCDCNAQIDATLARMATAHQPGLFIYFPDHEAYGLGIFEKMKIINRERREGKEFGELVDRKQLEPLESSVLWIVPNVLDALGFDRRVRLLSGSADKRRALEAFGVEIEGMEDLTISERGLTPEAIFHRRAAQA